MDQYPQKTLVVLLDNLASHKSQQIIKILTTYNRLEMLMTPSNSPQFSPIENMFGYVKQRLRDEVYRSKEELTRKVVNTMFKLTE